MPAVPIPAHRDTERMTVIEHRAIRVLSPYWHAGWQAAKPGAFVREGVAALLSETVSALPAGYGLAILDAWRPLALQAEIFAAAYADPALPDGFVSRPDSNPATPPPHLTGGAVDVTLTWHGNPLALGTAFDDFTDEARSSAYEQTPGRVRQLRRLLTWAMHDHGFRALDCEWWHFEIGTRRWAALTGNDPWYGAADITLVEPAQFTDRFRGIPR